MAEAATGNKNRGLAKGKVMRGCAAEHFNKWSCRRTYHLRAHFASALRLFRSPTFRSKRTTAGRNQLPPRGQLLTRTRGCSCVFDLCLIVISLIQLFCQYNYCATRFFKDYLRPRAQQLCIYLAFCGPGRVPQCTPMSSRTELNPAHPFETDTSDVHFLSCELEHV
jgi:hypothetical protein